MAFYTEYDTNGEAVEHSVDIRDPLEIAQEDLQSGVWGEVQLSKHLQHLDVTVTGAKENPDNAHGLFVAFRVFPLTTSNRRIVRVQELGGFWRRGVGVKVGAAFYGAWVPWFRPKKPQASSPERLDIAPEDLLKGLYGGW